jgi:hypothetical protein
MTGDCHVRFCERFRLQYLYLLDLSAFTSNFLPFSYESRVKKSEQNNIRFFVFSINFIVIAMKAPIAIVIATIYLVVFYILLYINASLLLTALLYLSIPAVIIGMVFVVLLDDSYDYPELPGNDEWGYRDKKKDDLWIV